jgi:hypothetical protein
MRHCPKCKKLKSLEEFGCNKNKPNGKQSACKECRRDYQRMWYKDNRETQNKRVRKNDVTRKLELQINLLKFYRTHPCVDCGETDPIVLECDHQRDKVMVVSNMICRKMSWYKIQQEISKCQVRCANCHRRKTAREQGWYKHVAGSTGDSSSIVS